MLSTELINKGLWAPSSPRGKNIIWRAVSEAVESFRIYLDRIVEHRHLWWPCEVRPVRSFWRIISDFTLWVRDEHPLTRRHNDIIYYDQGIIHSPGPYYKRDSRTWVAYLYPASVPLRDIGDDDNTDTSSNAIPVTGEDRKIQYSTTPSQKDLHPLDPAVREKLDEVSKKSQTWVSQVLIPTLTSLLK